MFSDVLKRKRLTGKMRLSFYLALIFFKVFDAYAQFEESMISAKMETTAEMGATEEGTFQQLWYSFCIAVILQWPETILRLERISSNTTHCSLGIGRVGLHRGKWEVLKNSCDNLLS